MFYWKYISHLCDCVACHINEIERKQFTQPKENLWPFEIAKAIRSVSPSLITDTALCPGFWCAWSEQSWTKIERKIEWMAQQECEARVKATVNSERGKLGKTCICITQAYVCATATAVFSIEKISFHCLLIFLLLVCEWKYKRAQNQYHYIAHRYTANQTKDSSKWAIFRLRPFYKYGRPSFLFHIFVLLCFVPVRTCVESFSVHTDQHCRVCWNKN